MGIGQSIGRIEEMMMQFRDLGAQYKALKKDIDEGIRLFGSFKLEKDDTIKATVYNTNPTMAQPNGDITTNYASATATVY